MTRGRTLPEEDEIEAFHAQRERILLGSASSCSDSGSGDEAILDLPGGDSDGEEQWGKTRRTFYSADTAAGDLEDEAREARKMQRRMLGTSEALPLDAKYTPGVVRLDLEVSDSSESDDDRFASATQLRRMSSKDVAGILSKEDAKGLPKTAEVSAAHAELQSLVSTTLRETEALVTAAKKSKADGLSFLQTKCELLVGYCANLAQYLLLQARGRFRPEHPVVARLVRYRLLLEKMRPLEARLQYAVDRLLHASDAGGAALAHRPNAAALSAPGLAAESSSEEEYAAPRVAPVRFGSSKRLDAEALAEEAASRARVVADMREEIEDRPAEEPADPTRSVSGAQARGAAAVREREAAEEERFVRFSLSAKEKRRLAALSNGPVDDLAELNDFLRGSSKPKTTAGRVSAADRLLGTKRPAKETPERAPSDVSDIEDDMDRGRKTAARGLYADVATRTADRKAAKRDRRAPVVLPRPESRGDARSARPAGREIMRNRGLMPARSREEENPRVAHRRKYERAQQKLKSFKTMPAPRDRPYAGESSGIRTNISRSVKFS